MLPSERIFRFATFAAGLVLIAGMVQTAKDIAAISSTSVVAEIAIKITETTMRLESGDAKLPAPVELELTMGDGEQANPRGDLTCVAKTDCHP